MATQPSMEDIIKAIQATYSSQTQSVGSGTDQLKTPADLLNAKVRTATEQRRRHWVEKRRSVSK
jgi:hypothetical protein